MLSSCGVPSNKDFVLAVFRRSEFAQHHLATLFKSSSKTLFAYDLSWNEKDNEILLSSTYESSEDSVVMDGRSFV